MGSSMGYICKTCGTHFGVRDGGGFYFDELHCDQCGRTESIGHKELGDIHLRFVKGLKIPLPSLGPTWTAGSRPTTPVNR